MAKNGGKKSRKKRQKEILNRRLPLSIYVGIGVLFAITLSWGYFSMMENETNEHVDIVVYRNKKCNCVNNWVDQLESEGLAVAVKTWAFLQPVRNDHGVPKQFRSCHTAVSNGFFVEGHVSAAHIRQLMQESRTILGIALPSDLERSERDSVTDSFGKKVVVYDLQGNATQHYLNL